MTTTGTGTETGEPLSLVERFETYGDYLSSHLALRDLEYLEDEEMARQLVELGFRGSGAVMRREDFEEQRQQHLQRQQRDDDTDDILLNLRSDLHKFPVLEAIAQRQEAIKSGKLAPILFIRDINSKGQEVSAYIDITQRMKETDFDDIFTNAKPENGLTGTTTTTMTTTTTTKLKNEKEDERNQVSAGKLIPRTSDLSYFNYSTRVSTANTSAQYQVITDNATGLLFKNKRDRRLVNPNPLQQQQQQQQQQSFGEGTTRITFDSCEYLQAVLYDHSTRQKL